MKKCKWLWILAAFVVLVKSIYISSPVEASSPLEDVFELNLGQEVISEEEMVKHQDRALAVLEEILPVIEKNPDCYGGRYINKYGDLVIMLTDDLPEENRAKIEQEFREKGGPDFYIRYVKYTYLQLKSLDRKIINLAQEKKYPVVSSGVSEYLNLVQVDSTMDQKEQEAFVKELGCEPDMIGFAYSEGPMILQNSSGATAPDTTDQSKPEHYSGCRAK